MKILFVTRNFPPQKGGLEKVASELYSHLSKSAEVILIKWSGSKRWLFLILPFILVRALFSLSSKRIEIIYLFDGLLSIFAPFLRFFKVPVVITIHGLDITYKNRLYQFIIPKAVSSADKVICISNSTREECINRGVPQEKICVIPIGIGDEIYMDNKGKAKELFEKEFKMNLSNKKILLSVGRLIERKGIQWFVREVVPIILSHYPDCLYLIAGRGVMKREIEKTIKERGLEGHVLVLGEISNQQLKLAYNIADIFIMPNIPVKADVEGFGVVILEAASCKLAIAASNLEGIKDALVRGEMGIPISPLSVSEFSRQVICLLKNDKLSCTMGAKARRTAKELFSWEIIGARYLDTFQEVSHK